MGGGLFGGNYWVAILELGQSVGCTGLRWVTPEPHPLRSLRQMLPIASGVEHAKRGRGFEYIRTLIHSPLLEDSGLNLRIFFEHSPVNPGFQERFKSIYELLF